MTSDPRPGLVTTFSLGVLILSTLYLARFALGLQLPDLPFSVPAWYVWLSGAVWGFGGLLLAWGFYAGRSWAGRATPWGVLTFALWYWADRIILARSDYVWRTWPLALMATALGLLWTGWTIRHPMVRQFFGESRS